VYTSTLYVSSNDPVNPLIQIPVTMTVAPFADLAITGSAAPDPVRQSQPLTYTLTVSNTGPDDTTGVIVMDTLPVGVTFDHASAGCSEASGEVTCDVGDLAAGNMVELTIVVMAPPMGGEITNTAMVSSDLADADLTNNTATQLTMVSGNLYLPFVQK
jgi:uncharacterized repeat protein (TIGR01451 family)